MNAIIWPYPWHQEVEFVVVGTRFSFLMERNEAWRCCVGSVFFVTTTVQPSEVLKVEVTSAVDLWGATLVEGDVVFIV